MARNQKHRGPAVIPLFNPSRTVQLKCKFCGRLQTIQRDYESMKGSCSIFGAKEWTDHVGESSSELIFSEDVVDDLKSIGAKGFESYAIPISKILDENLADLNRPNYYYIKVTGLVDLDRNLYDDGDGLLCPGCHTWSPRVDGKVFYGDKMTVPDMANWDGSDLVATRNIRSGRNYCTSRVVELARKSGWTGFEFKSTLPGLAPVNLEADDWLDELKAMTELRYPNLF